MSRNQKNTIRNTGRKDKTYLQSSVWALSWSRLPWLAILLISATFTSVLISRNEEMLTGDKFGILLTSCIPLIMGTGGNAGGQATVTVIRDMALGYISMTDFFRVIWKEVRVAIITSVFLSIICFVKIIVLDGLIFGVSGVNYQSAFVVSLALLFTIILAKLVGALLPMFVKALHIDPAVVASPFLTTILDIFSLYIFCGLSNIML